MTTTTTARPATEKQQAFILRLLAEKDATGTAYEGWTPDWTRATSATASKVIDFLMGLPRKSAPAAEALTDGIYVVDGTYFKVQTSPKTGNQYAKSYDEGEWEYVGRPSNSGITAAHKATAEQAARFGHTYGSCVFCSRTLTDERSVTVGYGPVCADHHGLPWGETVTA